MVGQQIEQQAELLARVVRPGGHVYAAELVLRETVAKPSQFTEAEWFA